MSLAIQTQNLGKNYGDLQAVKSLSLDIPEGQFFGLIGPNGSGKTTTIHILSTLIRPTSGRVFVAGHDVIKAPVAVRSNIGLVFQESALDKTLTVEENLQFAGALYGLDRHLIAERSRKLMDLFDLNEKRNAMVATLSGGMRRALDIARGVLHQPRILFLDEPTIGLDIINRRKIWRFMNQLRQEHGMTILLTTHYLEEAEPCDQVTFLRKGELIGQGLPAALINELGAFILEIEADVPEYPIELLQPQLGLPVQEGEKLFFRVPDAAFSISKLQEELQGHIQSFNVRKPDLNDVYIWKNSALEEGNTLC
jgi:ABC-2 type transport system ATP-binding protein